MGGERKAEKVSESSEEEKIERWKTLRKVEKVANFKINCFLQVDKMVLVDWRILHLDRFSLVIVPVAYLIVVTAFLATHAN